MATSTQTSAASDAGSRAALTRRSAESAATRSATWRAAPSLVAGLVACGLLLAMAWRQGGYFPADHLTAGAVAFGTLAVLLAVRPPHYPISTSALTAMASLAGLVVWTGLSAYWSSSPDAALERFQLGLVHAGILGLGLLAAGSGRYSRHLVWAAFGVIAAIAVGGLISRLYPGTLDPSAIDSAYDGYRLSYPLGYWNAMGAVGAMGVVLAAGLASDTRSPVALRALAAGLCVPIGTAAYLSFSRGAWLAFFVGLIVLVLASRRRIMLAATLGICGIALAATIGRVTGFDALTQSPDAGSGVVAEGRAFGPFVLAAAVLAAIGQVLLAGRWIPEPARPQLLRWSRRVGIVLAGLAVLAAGVVYVARTGKVESHAAERLIRADSWVTREWNEFQTPSAVGPRVGAERLKTARGTRSDIYRVAIDGFQAHPLWGDGAGGFRSRFAHDREVPEEARDPHSLYLEAMGELGLPGLVLVLGLVGAVAWAAITARRRQDVLSSGQSAAATAAFAVWAVHTGVDWDWRLPALTGAALLLAASLFAGGRRGRRRISRNRAPIPG